MGGIEMRSARRQRRLARLRRPAPPRLVTDAEVFARQYAREVAALADESGLDPDDVPAQWACEDEGCPCCSAREAEFELDRFWGRFVALAPCDQHEDCREHEPIGWACASALKERI